jgi:hypothetical protein
LTAEFKEEALEGPVLVFAASRTGWGKRARRVVRDMAEQRDYRAEGRRVGEQEAREAKRRTRRPDTKDERRKTKDNETDNRDRTTDKTTE